MRAQHPEPVTEPASGELARPAPARTTESNSPIRGSTLLFDQSMTTQTAHLETTPQQSYVPLYEWWLSFRPRWYFTRDLSLRVRADWYKELTNAEPTTQQRENVFGDVWTDLVYARTIAERGAWKNTRYGFGPRALWPTSKASQANGTYVTLGALANATQTIPLRGEGAAWLPSMRAGATLAYTHPFTSATTATSYGDFAYVRQDAEGYSFVSDQIRGQTLVDHQLLAILDTGVTITRKLAVTLDMIWIDQWHYAPTGGATVPVAGGGSVVVPRSPDDTQFTQSTWFLANVEYALMDEMSVGVGYYNLANAIAPDGQRRGVFGADNVWWSPDARVFLDVTANLDRIFDDMRSH